MTAFVLSSALAAGSAPATTLHPDWKLQRGEVQAYINWLAACDNQAQCVLLGFPGSGDAAVPGMGVQVTLSGPADAPPVVEILPVDPVSEAQRAEKFVLDVEYTVAAISPFHDYVRHTLNPLEAAAVIARLQSGRPLLGKVLQDERVRVRFPEHGFGRAWRAVSARRAVLLKQRAEAAIDALPGELPDGGTMPLPGALQRIVASEVMVSGFAPLLASRACGARPMRDMRRFRFANGSELWRYACGDAARTFWHFAHDASAMSQPLALPEPRLGGVHAGRDGLENAVFDFDFGVLRAYAFQPGREDCGTSWAWGFTSFGWHLLERREMPLCKGLSAPDWLRTHSTPSEGAGE